MSREETISWTLYNSQNTRSLHTEYKAISRKAFNSQVRDRDGYRQWVPHRASVFEGAICDGCPLRAQHMKAAPERRRSVSLQPQENLLQEARAFQASPPTLLGLRQARYRGRLKTEAQLLLTATVANLTHLWAQVTA